MATPIARTASPPRRLTDDQRDLVMAHLGLVKLLAARVAGRDHPDLDDLIQDGMVGLIAAVLGFDEARGTRFSSYATPWIAGGVIDGLGRLRPACSGASSMGESPDPGRPDDGPEAVDRRDLVDYLLGRALADRPRRLVMYRFGLDGHPPETQAAVGRRLGLCNQRAGQIEAEALRALRRAATDEVGAA